MSTANGNRKRPSNRALLDGGRLSRAARVPIRAAGAELFGVSPPIAVAPLVEPMPEQGASAAAVSTPARSRTAPTSMRSSSARSLRQRTAIASTSRVTSSANRASLLAIAVAQLVEPIPSKAPLERRPGRPRSLVRRHALVGTHAEIGARSKTLVAGLGCWRFASLRT